MSTSSRRKRFLDEPNGDRSWTRLQGLMLTIMAMVVTLFAYVAAPILGVDNDPAVVWVIGVLLGYAVMGKTFGKYLEKPPTDGQDNH